MRLAAWIAAAWLIAAPAFAQEPAREPSQGPSQEVVRAPVPSWVLPMPDETVPAPVDDAPVRLLAADHQIRFDAEGVHSYTMTRIRIQTAQGLALANTVNGVWNPSRQRLEAHRIRIIRDGQAIDALEGQSFQTLRRERRLESSMLDGVLTATLQPRDIRVGDILETAFTLHDDGGVLAPHQEATDSAMAARTVDRFRIRASWPADRAVRAMVTEPWTTLTPRRTRDGYEIEIDERNLAPMQMPGDLPLRHRLVRTLQLSDLADWNALSATMAPLYEKAATLEADSPLQAEIERIRQAHATPEAQVAAALRLVQDDVRYLALSMGEGGYVPATADETWRSRYGDCKGKTVLLLALLHGLGIEAEPAMVSTTLGDGLNERLPMVRWFDHVLVRTVVDGKVYWIDGARQGDRALAAIDPPGYRWALPVRAGGSGLEAIVQPPATIPTFRLDLSVDSSRGLDARADVTGDLAFTGDMATGMRTQMAAVPADRLQEALKSVWTNQVAGLEVKTADSRYDDATNTFHFLMTGTAPMAWTTASGGRFLAVPNAMPEFPVAAERADGPYKELPYAIAHPFYVETTLRMILPYGGEGFRIEGGDLNLDLGGYHLERRATLENGVVSMTALSRSLTHEVSAADMAQARDRREALGNSFLRVRAPSAYRPTEADGARIDVSGADVADLLERAATLAEADDADGALALTDRAVELEPDNAKARLQRGRLRLFKEDYAGAREDFDHAVDLDPADQEAVDGQGLAAYADGRFNDAIISFSVALRLDPTDRAALGGRAAAYHQIGRADRALTDYRALLAAAPGARGAQFGEVRALIGLNRHDEAQQKIDDLLKESAVDPMALGLRLRLAVSRGEPASALPALDTALAASPEDDELLQLRIEARIRAGDAEGARADLATMRRGAGTDPVRLNSACWTAGRMGFDLDQALADCEAALATLAEAASIIDSRAMVLLQMGRFEEARAAYDLALAGEPNQFASLYGRGLARRALGDAGGEEDIARARARNVDVGEDYAVFEQRRPPVVSAGS